MGQVTIYLEEDIEKKMIAKATAEIRARLEKQGSPIGPYDRIIAGTALTHGATLVSRNTKEFQRIKALRVENWYQ